MKVWSDSSLLKKSVAFPVCCVFVKTKEKKRKTKADTGKEGKLSKERKGKRGQLWTTKVQLANSGHQNRRN